jgi:hypothetical protein
MKKLTLYALLITALTSCTESKEAVFEKCLTQANETFSEKDIATKVIVIKGCMLNYGYVRNENCEATPFNSICYEKN